MGGGDERSPSKPSKSVLSTQETPVVTPSYADWTNSMQAYYGGGAVPPPFFAPMASPPPHPYMWGGQHPMMTPYGTPVPYPAIYPPPGVYAHPNMSSTPVTMQANVDSEVKVTEVKDRSSAKKSRVVTIAGNVTENGITASGSGNDGATQSAESGSAGSSEGSEENNNNELSTNKRGSFEKMLADGASAQNGVALVNSNTSVSGNPVSVPVTNLNMPMELWNPSGVAAMNIRPTTTGVSPVGIMNDQWVRDERDLKRQKRKQSNRESARRSRLRKQAECEELQQRVETLSSENHALRSELQRVSEESEKLTSENNSLKEELTRLCGSESVTKQEISGGCGGGGGESHGDS